MGGCTCAIKFWFTAGVCQNWSLVGFKRLRNIHTVFRWALEVSDLYMCSTENMLTTYRLCAIQVILVVGHPAGIPKRIHIVPPQPGLTRLVGNFEKTQLVNVHLQKIGNEISRMLAVRTHILLANMLKHVRTLSTSTPE